MVTALTYDNSVDQIPGWAPHEPRGQPRGYAYEYGGHFIHLFGSGDGQWVISSGLTFWESANGNLTDWAQNRFGAQNPTPLLREVGTVVDGVWRPGLYWTDQVFQALDTDRVEQRSAEQSLLGLIERLNELFLFVEPEGPGLDAFGPKMRELLILACTEVETVWTSYMQRAGHPATGQGYRTTDYVKLKGPLHLAEYQVALVPYLNAPIVRPFERWNSQAPTQSLAWYQAYNQTKHDRIANLSRATLCRCIEAVAASFVMYCVRYGPMSLYRQLTPLSSLVNHLFEVELVDCDPATFYLPLVNVGASAAGLRWGDSQRLTEPWTKVPLTI